MIKLETCRAHGAVDFDPKMASLPDGVVWIDLLQPSETEIDVVQKATGLKVPVRQDLVEIETSSRLSMDHDALYLSAVGIHRFGKTVRTTPLGFVLTPEVLVTVRYEELKAFEDFRQHVVKSEDLPRGSFGVFIGLQEAFVDRAADALEAVSAELDSISHEIFNTGDATTKVKPRHPTKRLDEVLKKVGRNGDLVSQIRDALLGVGRLIPYVNTNAAEWMPDNGKSHLETVRQDVLSLNDYLLHLEGKVQLLLDATLGLTNIDQNNIFRVLTVVSVVGIPPTLIASMYGMNFKRMPELDWAYGYPYGLTLIFLSAVIPLLIFKMRGWL